VGDGRNPANQSPAAVASSAGGPAGNDALGLRLALAAAMRSVLPSEKTLEIFPYAIFRGDNYPSLEPSKRFMTLGPSARRFPEAARIQELPRPGPARLKEVQNRGGMVTISVLWDVSPSWLAGRYPPRLPARVRGSSRAEFPQ